MKNIREIVELIFKQEEEDNKKKEAFGKIFDIIAPDSYRPFIQIGSAGNLIKLIGMIDKGLEEELNYFIYEAPFLYDKGWCIFKDTETQQEIVINSNEEAIDYIVKLYGEKTKK